MLLRLKWDFSFAATMSNNAPRSPVDLLILGAGWTSTFLIPLCLHDGVSYAATSRAGRDDTIQFEFDPHSEDVQPFRALPDAQSILIVFPIKVKGASERLVRLYRETHPASLNTIFIQLGSTGIWDGGPTVRDATHRVPSDLWIDRHSPFDATNDRANAEIELLALSPEAPTTVLNLCGLWGGQRIPKNWISRVAPTKDALKNKGSIHMIHGEDVARAVLAVHRQPAKATGQRWLLTDGRVYDWWDIASAWGSAGVQPRWVRELMTEEGVRALPRDAEKLGRAMDSREFWNTFELEPVRGRLE
ncbi:hypothetical protein A0H81_13754 [Grifola frondosa]|uniref:Uncharacterized protein n=1 Tax=Grifola frondosa TaxID=5627 RepID=A0A1C7LNP3_GRIFR|nr:hypothetical protein A0H81_13754 [Grifola frondosa]